MSTKKEIKERHTKANKALKDAFESLPDPKYTYVESIAKSMGRSKQTIYNYVRGLGKDGYITEAITQECLSIKTK
jgi:predicted transcriptional regulator